MGRFRVTINETVPVAPQHLLTVSLCPFRGHKGLKVVFKEVAQLRADGHARVNDVAVRLDHDAKRPARVRLVKTLDVRATRCERVPVLALQARNDLAKCHQIRREVFGAVKVERRHNENLVAVCVHFFHLFLDLVEVALRDDCLHRRLDAKVRKQVELVKHVHVAVALVNG